MTYYPTVFVSDLHLGSPWCRTAEFSAMLDDLQCDQLYLVGDILDGWHFKQGTPIPVEQIQLANKLLRLSNRIRIFYLTGNHDGFLRKKSFRSLFAHFFPKIQLVEQQVHITRNNKRFLVLHGDSHDLTLRVPLLEWASNNVYCAIRRLWEKQPLPLRKLGLDIQWLEKNLMGLCDKTSRLFGTVEHSLLRTAKKRGLDGVICGHTHIPALWQQNGLTYANCGYWTDGGQAIVECESGELELLTFQMCEAEQVAPDLVSGQAEEQMDKNPDCKTRS